MWIFYSLQDLCMWLVLQFSPTQIHSTPFTWFNHTEEVYNCDYGTSWLASCSTEKLCFWSVCCMVWRCSAHRPLLPSILHRYSVSSKISLSSSNPHGMYAMHATARITFYLCFVSFNSCLLMNIRILFIVKLHILLLVWHLINCAITENREITVAVARWAHAAMAPHMIALIYDNNIPSHWTHFLKYCSSTVRVASCISTFWRILLCLLPFGSFWWYVRLIYTQHEARTWHEFLSKFVPSPSIVTTLMLEAQLTRNLTSFQLPTSSSLPLLPDFGAADIHVIEVN